MRSRPRRMRSRSPGLILLLKLVPRQCGEYQSRYARQGKGQDPGNRRFPRLCHFASSWHGSPGSGDDSAATVRAPGLEPPNCVILLRYVCCCNRLQSNPPFGVLLPVLSGTSSAGMTARMVRVPAGARPGKPGRGGGGLAQLVRTFDLWYTPRGIEEA